MSKIESLEKKKKNGLLAAGLNLVLPGAGYIYCARVILGIGAFLLTLMIFLVYPYGSILIWVVLIIDGFLCADRYNKKLEKDIKKEMKKCPMCAELVQPEARVCKHCGHKFMENFKKEV